jgi:lipopolysaccharide export system protein LptA
VEKFRHTSLIALLLGAIFLCALPARAQLLELLPGSDRLSYDERTGMERLTGNVHFNYDGNTMFCDSAHYKLKTKEVWAYGRVQINKRDTLNLFCDSLYYNGKTRKAKLWGHVRVRDREYKLTTDTLEYDAKKTQAIYRHGGKIENITTNEVLTSRVGYFNPNTEESFFRGNVVYKSTDLKMTTDTLHYNYLKHRVFFYGPTNILNGETKLFCKKGWYDVRTEEGVLQSDAMIDQAPRIIHGDSLYYNPKQKIAIGRGDISVLDTAQKVELHGNYLYSDETLGRDMMTEKPWARLMKSKDTLYLGADTLYHFRDTANQTLRITGKHHVKIFQEKIQGRADSLQYDKAAGIMDLWGNPYFWSHNSELHGDSIRAYVKNDSLVDKVHLRYNAFAANEVDSGKYYNQLAGKEIWAYFRDNELVRADVLANARTIYFPTDTLKTDTSTVIKRMGMNRVYSADMKVYLDSGEVVGVTFLKQPEGILYPMDQIEESEQFLQGFTWNPALRPKNKEEIMFGEPPVAPGPDKEPEAVAPKQ